MSISLQDHAPETGEREPGGAPEPAAPDSKEALVTDLLILTDGTLLAHNLTREMADMLKQVHELPK